MARKIKGIVRKNPWINVASVGMFARVSVELDKTHPMQRNAFKCKGCGDKFPAHVPRYNFERYNFCQGCVSGATAGGNMEFETTLEIFVEDDKMVEIYEKIKEQNHGKPSFPLFTDSGILELGVYFNISAKFSDNSNFRITPGVASGSIGIKPLSFVSDCFNEDNEFYEWFPIVNEKFIKDGSYFFIERWDLKPFNISIKKFPEDATTKIS